MSAMIITKENFETEVRNASQPVLLDFWATWCYPCRLLSTTIDELSNELSYAKICKVNVEEQPELTQAFQVMSVPTLLVFKDGSVVQRSVGVTSKSSITTMLAG